LIPARPLCTLRLLYPFRGRELPQPAGVAEDDEFCVLLSPFKHPQERDELALEIENLELLVSA
jgi:hypothetical protein